MKRFAIALGVVLVGIQAYGQGIRTPGVVMTPELKHSVGFGSSLGVVLDNDKWFWGFAGDCGRQVGEHWVVAASLAYDQEIDDSKDGVPVKKVNTFTGAATVSYTVTESFSLTTGLGMGFLDEKVDHE